MPDIRKNTGHSAFRADLTRNHTLSILQHHFKYSDQGRNLF